MDADDEALLALEREAAFADANWTGGDSDGDDDLEAEMAREEARIQKLLASPQIKSHLAGNHDPDDQLDGMEEDGEQGPHHVKDSDVLGELAELEAQVHSEHGSGGGNAYGDLDEDRLLADAEAEADRLAKEDEKHAQHPDAPQQVLLQQQRKPVQPPPPRPARPDKTSAAAAASAVTPAVPPARPAKPHVVAPPTASQKVTSGTSSLSSAAPPSPAPAPSSASVESLPSLSAKLVELKKKAVELNRQGKKDEAMATMRNCKAVAAKIEVLKAKAMVEQQNSNAAMLKGQAAASSVTTAAPPRPAHPAASSSSSTPAAAASSTVSSAQSKLTIRAQLEYDSLIAKLNAQIGSLDESMKTLINEGAGAGVKAGSKESKLLALQYFRAKTRSTKDRDVLVLARERGLKPPATHTEQLSIQTELSFPRLSEDACEVLIHSGKDLHNPRIVSSPGDLAPTVGVALEYAVDMDGNMKTGTMQMTPQMKGQAPQWNHTVQLMFPCSRSNVKDKTILKKLLRSRLLLVLYHKRFLLGSIEVARGEIRLKDISTKSEASISLKLKDTSTGARCGEIDVTVRMRKPLEGIDLRVEKKEILVVDEFEEDAPQAAAAPGVQAAPSVAVAAPAESSSSSAAPQRKRSADQMNNPSSVSATPAAAASSSSTAPAPAPSSDSSSAPSSDSFGDIHAISKFHSNDLLEHEITRVESELARLRTTRPGKDDLDEDGVSKHATALEAAEERLTAAKIALEVLVTRVQNGKLTLADYLAQLKIDIVTESQLALQLAKANRKPDAARIVERVKILKAEVANAEENQDQLEAM
jgi:hypothetical protein